MKEDYYNKNEFIKDFIKLCRDLRRKHRENVYKQTGFLHKFVGICGESWSFCFYVDADKISTEAALIQGKNIVKFPKTTWGDHYCRWDSELREFLNREVCKTG